MTAKEAKEDAQKIFTSYHNLIQDIGGDYGQEILVSILAKECALIALNKILTIKPVKNDISLWEHYAAVEYEIKKL